MFSKLISMMSWTLECVVRLSLHLLNLLDFRDAPWTCCNEEYIEFLFRISYALKYSDYVRPKKLKTWNCLSAFVAAWLVVWLFVCQSIWLTNWLMDVLVIFLFLWVFVQLSLYLTRDLAISDDHLLNFSGWLHWTFLLFSVERGG